MATFALGTMLVMPDNGSGLAGLMTLADQSVVKVGGSFGDTEIGAALNAGSAVNTGVFATLDFSNNFRLYGSDLSLIASPTPFTIPAVHEWDGYSPMAAVNATNALWASFIVTPPTGANAQLRKVFVDGTLGATTFDLAIATIRGLAVNADESMAYYGDSAVGGAIKRWDLVNNIALADFVAGATTNQIGFDGAVDASGNIWFAYQTDHSVRASQTLKQWSPAGALLRTLTPPTSVNTGNGFDIRMAIDTGDPSLIWAQTFPTLSTTTFVIYAIATGSVQDQFTVPNGTGSAEIPFSCPFFPRSFPAAQPLTFAGQLGDVAMKRLRRAPHLSNEQLINFYKSFQVDCTPGTALVTGQGSDPELMMRFSDDGGHTWSQEMTVSLGLNGAYQTRVKWQSLGSSRDRIFEVSFSDPVFLALLDAFIDVEQGIY
jgi:hypothetical protein